MRHFFQVHYLFFLLLSMVACTADYEVQTAQPLQGDIQDIEKQLQSQFILANDGDTIDLPSGVFGFSKSILLEGKSDILIRGAGMDQTILTFKDQEEGAEGIRVSNGNNITLADFTIQDAKGDNIKTNDINGISFINVKSEWTGEPNEKNGAYALYPVMCQNVLIDGCVAIGASDAGIYVGQSTNVIVKNSEAYNNVAGIEIENTINADVFDNEAHDNTGGILVFDLPGLSQLGRRTRVFDNKVYRNNYTNFAPEGNIVGAVPPGTGLMILASKDVEIFNNEITDNRTGSVALISYLFVEATSEPAAPEAEQDLSMAGNIAAYKADKDYDPFPSGVSIHDNVISNSYTLPTFENDIGYLLLFAFWMDKPEILYDGITDPELGDSPDMASILCVQNNGNVGFANLDAFNEFANVSEDASIHDCSMQPLPKVDLNLNLLASE
ncbi:MAG: parallel beta-helix domain-containing protein [Bacteroidota bacterium]